jgi:hypothetical protein
MEDNQQEFVAKPDWTKIWSGKVIDFVPQVMSWY